MPPSTIFVLPFTSELSMRTPQSGISRDEKISTVAIIIVGKPSTLFFTTIVIQEWELTLTFQLASTKYIVTHKQCQI